MAETPLQRAAWAGLLACSADDSGLLFADLLARLTAGQLAILSHVCQHARKRGPGDNRPSEAFRYILPIGSIMDLAGHRDFHRLMLELQFLTRWGLMNHTLDTPDGAEPALDHLRLTPTNLGLELYVRCQGSRLPPGGFFGLAAESAATQPSRSPG